MVNRLSLPLYSVVSLDETCLYLPAQLSVFAEPPLNRTLYFWLAAFACTAVPIETHRNLNWLVDNQQRTLHTLRQFRGLQQSYQRLVEAFIALRPVPTSLKADAAAQERAIQQALQLPGSVSRLPEAKYDPTPVPLWLHPNPPHSQGLAIVGEGQARQSSDGQTRQLQQRRFQAERVETPEEVGTTLGVRHEADLFSFAEFCKMDRSTEEGDLDAAESIANDIDNMLVSQDNSTVANRIKFDLDLPSAQEDDIPLSDGVLYPEWDYKRNWMLADLSLSTDAWANDDN